MNGLILARFDNFDLVLLTPNGRRETHLMALEFMKNSCSVSSCSAVTTSDLCARVHIPATDMEYDEDHITSSTIVATSNILESSFLTNNARDMSVPRLPKQEATKVDISSHCAIPLLHHAHPQKTIPNSIKPGQTMSDQDLRSNSEINVVQQSVERAQK